MKIDEIKAALAKMAANVEPMTEQPTAQPKSRTKATAPVKDAAATKSNRTDSASGNQAVPASKATTLLPVTTVKQTAPAVNTLTQAEQKPIEPEKQPTPKQKKTTTRKAKTALVIPIDGIEAMIAKHLKAGVDYDAIPGCGRKPALLKAGAEKLAEIYGFRMTSKVINRVERFDQCFVLYEIQTTIYDGDGNIVAEGLGSCNSKERRYQRGDFAANLNTVLKMAKKRSFVDAVLSATHASGVFTQDIEDIAVDTRMAAIG